MACALEPYLRVYTAEIQPRYILEFLLFDEDFPRSIRFATARIEEHLSELTRHAEAGGRAGPTPGRPPQGPRCSSPTSDELERQRRQRPSAPPSSPNAPASTTRSTRPSSPIRSNCACRLKDRT